MVYRANISKKEQNARLPKEKVIAEFIIRIPRGGCVTVVHQDVPPADGQNCEMGWRIGHLTAHGKSSDRGVLCSRLAPLKNNNIIAWWMSAKRKKKRAKYVKMAPGIPFLSPADNNKMWPFYVANMGFCKKNNYIWTVFVPFVQVCSLHRCKNSGFKSKSGHRNGKRLTVRWILSAFDGGDREENRKVTIHPFIIPDLTTTPACGGCLKHTTFSIFCVAFVKVSKITVSAHPNVKAWCTCCSQSSPYSRCTGSYSACSQTCRCRPWQKQQQRNCGENAFTTLLLFQLFGSSIGAFVTDWFTRVNVAGR